jgi:CO/xanthine dehydrogenase FAD-binding subunit
MKPVAFDYVAPREVDEALALLAEHGDEAKVLAGGQSLVPMLNYRLVRPATLIDVNRIAVLGALRFRENVLHVGALTRTALLESCPEVARDWPLLAEAAGFVGHAAIRNRGTVGGSAAHADPQAELPAALLALDVLFHVRSTRGARSLAADEFFCDFFTTALAADEMLVEIEVPVLAPRTGCAFVEHSRTHGDFALAGVAVTVALAPDGRCARARIAVLGGGSTPLRARDAETLLNGAAIDDGIAREAGAAAALACDPPEPADYRRALVAELTRRAVITAAGRVTA